MCCRRTQGQKPARHMCEGRGAGGKTTVSGGAGGRGVVCACAGGRAGGAAANLSTWLVGGLEAWPSRHRTWEKGRRIEGAGRRRHSPRWARARKGRRGAEAWDRAEQMLRRGGGAPARRAGRRTAGRRMAKHGKTRLDTEDSRRSTRRRTGRVTNRAGRRRDQPLEQWSPGQTSTSPSELTDRELKSF